MYDFLHKLFLILLFYFFIWKKILINVLSMCFQIYVQVRVCFIFVIVLYLIFFFICLPFPFPSLSIYKP